jgi:hypothetical protein
LILQQPSISLPILPSLPPAPTPASTDKIVRHPRFAPADENLAVIILEHIKAPPRATRAPNGSLERVLLRIRVDVPGEEIAVGEVLCWMDALACEPWRAVGGAGGKKDEGKGEQTAMLAFPGDLPTEDEAGGLGPSNEVDGRVEGEAAGGEVAGLDHEDAWGTGRHGCGWWFIWVGIRSLKGIDVG